MHSACILFHKNAGTNNMLKDSRREPLPTQAILTIRKQPLACQSPHGFLESCKSIVSYIVNVPPYRFIASSILAKNSVLIFSSIAIWSE